MTQPISRRTVLRTSVAGGLSAASCSAIAARDSDGISPSANEEQTCLTSSDEFYTVARGKPKPHTLTGQALVDAGMTPESWKLEITVDPDVDPPVVSQKATAEKELLKENDTALDYDSLLEIGRKKSVKLIKAIQCLNIDRPLGQGLWEGVALRDVLHLCGKLKNVRRIYYWGFHNNSPEQKFQSSLSYTQAFDAAPDGPPVFLAYRLNGKPIKPIRGGPVRMIVPWAYGFKSIKWLQRIVLSNDPRANDTYSNQNNDPDSPMKTAAYLQKNSPRVFKQDQTIQFSGVVVSGLSGLAKVQFLLRKVDRVSKLLPHDHPEILNGDWKPASVVPAPTDWKAILPEDVRSNELVGFDSLSGHPTIWPVRYGMTNWETELGKLKPGNYEFRVRSIDQNGFAQPEPRPLQKSGRNSTPVHCFTVE